MASLASLVVELPAGRSLREEKVRRRRLEVTLTMSSIASSTTVTAVRSPVVKKTDGDKLTLQADGRPPFAFFEASNEGRPRGSFLVQKTVRGVPHTQVTHVYYENDIAYFVEATFPNARMNPFLDESLALFAPKSE